MSCTVVFFRHRRIRFPLLLPGLSQSPRHIRPPLGDPSQQVLPTWNNTIFIAKWTLKVGTKPHFCHQSLSPKFDVAASGHPYKCGAVVRSETRTWPFRKAMIYIDLQQPNCWTFCRALQLSTVGTRMLDCAEGSQTANDEHIQIPDRKIFVVWEPCKHQQCLLCWSFACQVQTSHSQVSDDKGGGPNKRTTHR